MIFDRPHLVCHELACAISRPQHIAPLRMPCRDVASCAERGLAHGTRQVADWLRATIPVKAYDCSTGSRWPGLAALRTVYRALDFRLNTVHPQT